MSKKCTFQYGDQKIDLPVLIGTENEVGVDISKLRSSTGCITYDDGYGNTGSCQGAVTFINGEEGILRYRGYSIEQLAEMSTFTETAYLIIFGELPNEKELAEWKDLLSEFMFIHESMRHHFEGFPDGAHPMAILSAMINATSCFFPRLNELESDRMFKRAAARLISQVRTIAAFAYKKSVGRPRAFPKSNVSYTENFLHMMFSMPNNEYVAHPDVTKALSMMFLLHADHEQNCSTSTVRMVGSSGANLFASCSAGVCALWGPLHGGANQAVVEMLDNILESGQSLESIVARAKDKDDPFRLMGFGHRVYKNFDPRAKIIKKACDGLLTALKIDDPALNLAKQLEEVALSDPYFVERKLYPNVDFYSGIILRALGIPTEMFTVLFAIGRMPGWISNWKETQDNPHARIYRPRQVYQGPTLREYVPLEKRG